MIESIKDKIWNLLKEKGVSLSIVFSRDGEILWHKGREIKGKKLEGSCGFSKSLIKKAIKDWKIIQAENEYVMVPHEQLPESAHYLNIKSIVIVPISEFFLLYADSGTKESFNQTDIKYIQSMGELLAETIDKIFQKANGDDGLTGCTEAIKQIKELIAKYAFEDGTILITGETGVGKSHIAEMIHQYSGRKGKFVTINVPSLSENLFEVQLFGNKKGAFTDARQDKMGFVDEVAGGTLFFDEISEIPLIFQAKLLRFIDTKKYTVLGESVEKTADVRIIAATNQNLKEMIKKNNFRQDLYYRLKILEIEIPPLRQRKEDIKALIKAKNELLRGKEFTKDAIEMILSHQWPGNVRELIAVLTRAGINCQSPMISVREIKKIIDSYYQEDDITLPADKIAKLIAEMKSGEKDNNFQEVIKEPYLNRDLNRAEVKAVIHKGLQEVDGRYVSLLELFKIEKKDYNKFMCFLHDNNLRPDKLSGDK